MARLSYGGDLFSPIRCDNSLNEDSFLAGRNSDIFFGTLKDISYDDNSTGKQDKEATGSRKDKPNNGKETVTGNSNLSSKGKSSESLVDTSNLKNVSQEVDLSKNKLSHITTRKNSLRNPKKTNELPERKTDFASKKANDKQKLSQHVTRRSGSRKKSTQLVGDLKQNNKFSCASCPTVDEERIEKSIYSSKSHKDNLLKHLGGLPEKQISGEPKSIEFELNSTCDSFADYEKEKQSSLTYKGELSSNSNYNKSEVTPSTANCESQTDLLMSELSPAINKAFTEKHNMNACLSQQSDFFSSQNSNQSQKIQAGIIEKLVKDTVSFEFDAIRQMLYLQQLSLFKHLDRNAEAMKQNSSDCDVLLKIIDELIEENRQLRKIIVNQNH